MPEPPPERSITEVQEDLADAHERAAESTHPIVAELHRGIAANLRQPSIFDRLRRGENL
jgi:hypothetical protein